MSETPHAAVPNAIGATAASSALTDELKLPDALRRLPARVALVDLGLRCVDVNESFLAFHQAVEQADIRGQHLGELFPDEAYDLVIRGFTRLKGGESLRWEGWCEHPRWGVRYLTEELMPYRDDAGQAIALIAFGQDQTEAKTRERELSEHVETLERAAALNSAIFEHAVVAMLTTDARGVIQSFNPAAERLLGYGRLDAIGRPVGDLIIPERFRSAHEAGMKRAEAGVSIPLLGRRLELAALCADGRELPVEIVLWRTAHHGTHYYTASLFDLTERRRAAEEIERQREALRQSEKLTAMGSLLAGVAHELNNPLSIVIGRASLLEDRYRDQPELAADIERIRDAAERCGRIVRTFLNMARQRPPERGPVRLNDLARAATEMLAYTYRSHGIAVELRVSEDLPEVIADGDQIGQVVLNLLVNAQQALAGVAEPRRVRVSTGIDEFEGARHAWLRVGDNGPGVPIELRDKIFEPFFTTKAEGSGTGLGLAVSRTMLRENDGDLILDTGIGGGSTFTLRLPLDRPGSVRDTGSITAQAPTNATSRRVLVVDDEEMITEMIRTMLERAGYSVATASDGGSALQRLESEDFDAIVSDLRMPDMDGAALWREVKRRHPALSGRMLFVTGDSLSPAARQFLTESRCAVLDKPFRKSDLLARVGMLLA